MLAIEEQPRLEEYRDVAPRARSSSAEARRAAAGRRFVHVNAAATAAGLGDPGAARTVAPGSRRRRHVGGHRRGPGVLRGDHALETALSGQPAAITEAMLVSCGGAATNAATLRLESDFLMVTPPALRSSATARAGPLGLALLRRPLPAWRRAWHLVGATSSDTTPWCTPCRVRPARPVPMLVVHRRSIPRREEPGARASECASPDRYGIAGTSRSCSRSPPTPAPPSPRGR
jgi:hypothetical protein